MGWELLKLRMNQAQTLAANDPVAESRLQKLEIYPVRAILRK